MKSSFCSQRVHAAWWGNPWILKANWSVIQDWFDTINQEKDVIFNGAKHFQHCLTGFLLLV
jgi:hypothetical protein